MSICQRYRLDGKLALPDPASRWQPEGPHGPSEVIDPNDYMWHDSAWYGVALPGQFIYEMHIGTFTPEGTFAAAARELAALASLGVTVIEIMPVNEFDGQFGWGYDGVDLFAPRQLYGSPAELRRFVDQAHSHGLAVLLDVVYNHFGPNGNYVAKEWTLLWSSEDPKYGGSGTGLLDTRQWRVPGHATIVLSAAP